MPILRRRNADVASEKLTCLRRATDAVLEVLLAPVVSEDDTNDEYVRKLAIVLAITGAAVFGSVSFMATFVMRGFIQTILNLALIPTLASSIVAYIYLWRVKRVTGRLLVFLGAVWSILVMAADLHYISSYQPPMWPLFVVIIDVLLVCNVGTAATVRYVWFVAFWLTLTSVESGFRFGLYDIPGLAPREQREEMVECANPPCKLKPWLQALSGQLSIFLLDFAVTRSFAARLREQTAALSESVEVAGRIAQHLAAYDLESAEADLRKAGRLPPEMSYELENLLRNLKSYRPFLPYALFRQRDDGGGGGGARGGEGVNERAPTTAASTAEVNSVVSLTSADGCRPTDSPPRSPAGGPTKSNDFTIVRQMRLEPKRVSLLGVFLRRPQALSDETVGEYVTKHTAALSTVFAAVTRQRGSLDHFQGDHLFASYNAFGTAINHALGAINASMVVVKEAQAKCAVVSGEVFAGYLGTATVRSPSIVGELPSLLGQAMEAASVVKEDMVCCGETAQSSMFAVALRLLLHRFWLRGDERATLLWTTEGSHSPVVYAEEWMYEVEENGSLAWSHYNDAARMHHVHGNAVALSHARNGLLNAQMHQRFIEESQSALWVDLRVRQTTLAAAPAVAAKDNVPPPDISMETC